jgi:hypothetical protein
MMRKPRVYSVAAAAFAALSLCAIPVHAQERGERRTTEQHRVYDPVHKDYHAWNDDENSRYRTYLDEHHEKYRDFSRLSKKRQREYWQWRHEHEIGR